MTGGKVRQYPYFVGLLHTSRPLRSVELSKEWQRVHDWGKVRQYPDFVRLFHTSRPLRSVELRMKKESRDLVASTGHLWARKSTLKSAVFSSLVFIEPIPNEIQPFKNSKSEKVRKSTLKLATFSSLVFIRPILNEIQPFQIPKIYLEISGA